MPVALLLPPRGSAHKAIERCQLQEATDQAKATRANLAKPHMERHTQAVEKCETGAAFKTCHPLGTRIQTLLPHVPRLPRGARNKECFGGLPLRESLGVQGTLLVEQGSASRSLPSLLAIRIATWHGMHYSAHSYLLLPKLMPCEKWMAKDGEVAPSFPYLAILRLAFARSLSFRDGRRRDRSLSLDAWTFTPAVWWVHVPITSP